MTLRHNATEFLALISLNFSLQTLQHFLRMLVETVLFVKKVQQTILSSVLYCSFFDFITDQLTVTSTKFVNFFSVNHDIDVIVLDSPVGSVFEGLSIAGVIFDRKLQKIFSECRFITSKFDMGVYLVFIRWCKLFN